MKKIIIAVLFLVLGMLLVWVVFEPKIAPYYIQLTRERAPLNADLRPPAQKEARYTGTAKCRECHLEKFKAWRSSPHSRMIANPREEPSAVTDDFSKLPEDADFKAAEVAYTVGSLHRQCYMMPARIGGGEDFRIGNYQWNRLTGRWEPFGPGHEWYRDAYPDDPGQIPTSHACDGCHFTGFMATGRRVEPSIGCESCHGPGSAHDKNPESTIFRASMHDPVRGAEICLQCHMRGRDRRLREDPDVRKLWMRAKDFPEGYRPGLPLMHYLMAAPFRAGTETEEFWPNGAAKRDRSEGNEFVRDAMFRHGITCVNCHDPHTLAPHSGKTTNNEVCMRCHTFNGVIGPHQASLRAHTHHKPDSEGSLCVACHMPKTGRRTPASPITVRSHLFRFVSPAETKAYGMPPETNACYDCHRDKTLDALQKDLETWGETRWDSRELLSHYLLEGARTSVNKDEQ